MKRPISAIWLVIASTLVLAAMACKPGGVGDPCIPEDEYQPTFGGYVETEVNVESRSFQCETRVCLVNHFRGRVTCPYGQGEGDVPKNPACDTCSGSLPPDHPNRCRIPGKSGTTNGEADAVQVSVKSQLVQRTAAASPDHGGDDVHDAVYCSCRCGGPDPNAKYCDCPSGFDCEPLIEDLGFGSTQLAGSYCIRSGSKFKPGVQGLECSPIAGNCGNKQEDGTGRNP